MAELVSIITPMYNSENFIEEAILSVLKQSYTNWEMLIIDDGSKDKSIEIVEKYLGRDNRIKLIRNKNCSVLRFVVGPVWNRILFVDLDLEFKE